MAIRIGVVGLGQIARKRHLPAIAGNPDFELTGLASLGGGAEIGGLPVHDDHRAMLAASGQGAVAAAELGPAQAAFARWRDS